MSNFQTKVIKEYESKGYVVHNLIRLSENGYPDLLCVKPDEVIYIEVKEWNDTLKELQKYRIRELRKKGFKAFCLQDKKGIIY